MIHMPGCIAAGREDDGLFYLGELDTSRADWREYVADLLEVREELGCGITRFVAHRARGSRSQIETDLELYDTDRDGFVVMAALSSPID
jgi:hypothetical protein